MNEPLISVVIPMYNLEKFIEDTLKSVLENDFDNFEIICVNDGSTDKTAELCEILLRKYPEFKLISTENHGVSHARNIGLKNASGKYVIFMDGDDMLKCNALSTVARNLKTDCDILVFGAEMIGESTDYPADFVTGVNPETGEYEYSPNILFHTNGVLPFVWNKIFRRRFLLDNSLEFDTDLRLGEDQVFLLSAFPTAKKIRFISDKVYIYRLQRPFSASTTLAQSAAQRCTLHLDDLENISELWKNNEYYSGAQRQFCKWCCDFAVNSVLIVKSRKDVLNLAARLSEIIDKNEIPYKSAKLKSRLKFEIIRRPFLMRMFFVYRIFRWHI